MAHVYARISGHGSIVLPRAPYRIGRVETERPAVRVEHRTSSVTLTFSPNLDIQLGPNTSSVDEVCDLSRSESVTDFVIETGLYSVGWPNGFDIVGGIEAGPSPFDLVSDDAGLVYVQGPFAPERLPTIARMVAPGQEVIGIGRAAHGEWIELEYLHEGVSHWQRHTVLSFPRATFAVTSQSSSLHAPVVRAAADLVATTFRPTAQRPGDR